MANYIAAVEVDQIQKFIFSSDTLQEILGAANFVNDMVVITEEVVEKYKDVEVFWPVSGVPKLRATDLQTLSRCLWKIKEEISSRGISVTFAIQEESPTFSKALLFLEKKIRRLKDSKTGVSATPECPFMARCLIQPELPANHWRPGESSRRRLVSDKSYCHRTANQNSKFMKDFKVNNLEMPRKIEDLVADKNDSYIAFIKADGDGMGKVLASLEFADHEKAKEFSTAVKGCIDDSVKEAMRKTLDIHSNIELTHSPFLPLLIGGEDIWILTRKDMALTLVKELGTLYERKAEHNDILSAVLTKVDLKGKEKFSLSFGILFALKGFPFDAQYNLVNELVKSAKKRRKGLPSENIEGCVDFFKYQSSGRESIASAREKGYGIKDNKLIFKLFTAPWTISELKEMLDAKKNLYSISRKKLYQLNTILRLGDKASQLAYNKWWLSLTTDEQIKINETLKAVPEAYRLIFERDEATNTPMPLDPWSKGESEQRITPLLDLVELLEI